MICKAIKIIKIKVTHPFFGTLRTSLLVSARIFLEHA
jgi:hypothetical protein